jgi:pyruvate kinase
MQRHEGPRARQTRIVATIGRSPSGDFAPFLEQLCAAGADVLRLNMSHADADYAKERQILAWANQPMANHTAPRVAVMADLQGPKCRIGKLPGDALPLREGQAVVLVPEGAAFDPRSEIDAAGEVPAVIPVPEPVGTCLLDGLRGFLASQARLNPSILFGDGDLSVEVAGLGAGWVRATVSAGGVLGSKKGLTVRELDLDLDPFPEKDQRDLKFALDQGVDFVALSFVRTAADVERVRAFVAEHLPQGERPPRLIAKIETLAAVRGIDDVLTASDGIMVARGDLGLQLGMEEVPAVQKRLVASARRHGKPCIIATQMLESMITLPVPTRAEATDVFNAILDGGDAVMLSGETSVGSRPIRVVETMDRIVRKAEAYHFGADRSRDRRMQSQSAEPNYIERINGEFARTAAQFAEALPAFAIACFSRTGRTPERISRFRPAVPILALCATERVARQCLLFWGLHPILLAGFDVKRDRMSMMSHIARGILREDYGMGPGDALVVTAGVDWPKGGTNALQVLIEDHSAVGGRRGEHLDVHERRT